MTKKALIIISPGFEEIEAICPMDILNRADIHVTTAGVERKRVPGSHGIMIDAKCMVEDVATQDFDAIVLPGGMPNSETLGKTLAVEQIVERHFHAGKIIAAICAAPGLALAPIGILDGKQATCYPGFEKHFPESATYVSDKKVVVDGNLITSKGPGTAFEFALEIVRQLIDPGLADMLADGMQFTK
ncbi:MAG: DJ-1 family glyoxalase III [Planctomycetota bacterium]|jgi:4-methyl-5(b-hydroxyethyl)-thiazole monophosphate biosynthesis